MIGLHGGGRVARVLNLWDNPSDNPYLKIGLLVGTHRRRGHYIFEPLEQLRDIGVDAICDKARVSQLCRGLIAQLPLDGILVVGLNVLCSALEVG